MNKISQLIIAIILLSNTNLHSQNRIDSNNYYDYYSNGENLRGSSLKTIWLNKIEVSKIAEEELKNAGFKWISTFRIIKLDSINYVNSICYTEKSNFGFVYESSHMMNPKKENREIISIYKNQTGNDYSEKIINIDGESQFLKIKSLPKNLYLIKEDIYWYQQTNNPKDDENLVTKEKIIEILRKDLREIIKKISTE